MSIASKPYYWLVCDGCGERADYDEFTAWEDPGQAIDSADEWTSADGKHHCPDCPPLDADPPEYDPDDAEAQRIAETCADANAEYDRIEAEEAGRG